jgi:hypothetical protein
VAAVSRQRVGHAGWHVVRTSCFGSRPRRLPLITARCRCPALLREPPIPFNDIVSPDLRRKQGPKSPGETRMDSSRRSRPGAIMAPAELISLVVTATGAIGCATAAPPAPAGPPAPQPLSAEAQAKVDLLLPGCDDGHVGDCVAVGRLFRAEHRFEEAVAAYDHACSALRDGGRDEYQSRELLAEHSRHCAVYVAKSTCDPDSCRSECASDPACRGFSAEACANRGEYCPYDSLRNCLVLESASACQRASEILADEMRPDQVRHHCSPQTVSQYQQALGYSREACGRFDGNPAARNLAADRHGWCESIDYLEGQIRNCAAHAASDREHQRYMAEQNARLLSIASSSFQSLAQTSVAAQAASAGFVPGAPAAPGTPPTFVNPRTGATWRSGNTAFIASRAPRRTAYSPHGSAPARAAAPPARPASYTGASAGVGQASGASPTASSDAQTQAAAGTAPADPASGPPPRGAAGSDAGYTANQPSSKQVVSYWNSKTGRFESAVADNAGEVQAKLEYARQQCRFWSKDPAEAEYCRAATPCQKTGWFAAAVGRGGPNGFRLGWACGAPTKTRAEQAAVEQCAADAAACTVETGDSWELRE